MRNRLPFVLLTLLVAGGAFCYGYLAHRHRLFPAGVIHALFGETKTYGSPLKWGQVEGLPGRWHNPNETGYETESDTDMLAFAYLTGSNIAPDEKGVTVNDPERAYRGYNLYLSAHGAETFLTDMEGKVLHRWGKRLSEVWPEHASIEGEYWRRVHLLPNGDLLAIYDGVGMVRLAADSTLAWSYPGKCHHDLDVDAEGRIHTLAREKQVVPDLDPDREWFEDFIVMLSPDGEELSKFSLYEALRDSKYRPILDDIPSVSDFMHTNTIAVLDGSLAEQSPYFAKGNLLVSILALNTIAIVDPEERKVVWALKGLWRRQHEPVLLDSGRILMFENEADTMRSRVFEFDPFTHEVFWEFTANRNRSFYSKTCGTSHRLPNGNTLIVESDRGRALELTPDGAVVWVFVNPHRAGEENELIATLFNIDRLPPDFPVKNFLPD